MSFVRLLTGTAAFALAATIANAADMPVKAPPSRRRLWNRPAVTWKFMVAGRAQRLTRHPASSAARARRSAIGFAAGCWAVPDAVIIGSAPP